MKINLLLQNPGGVRQGYLNVDPFAPEDATDRVKADVGDLSPFVDAGEVEELVVHDVLDYVPGRKADAVLNHWVSLLAHGGTLSLLTLDMRLVAKALTNRRLSLDDANLLFHGDQSEPWQTRQATYSLNELVAVLEGKGLKILKRRNDGYKAFLLAQRP